MVRPRKRMFIRQWPVVSHFRARFLDNAPIKKEVVLLNVDELECLRLADVENLVQIEAAEIMGVHQSTFQRNLTRARKKIADALINGKSIKIEGGAFKMPNRDGTGPEGKGPMTGRKQGRCKGNTEEEQRPRLGLGRRDGRGLGRGLGRGRRN